MQMLPQNGIYLLRSNPLSLTRTCREIQGCAPIALLVAD